MQDRSTSVRVVAGTCGSECFVDVLIGEVLLRDPRLEGGSQWPVPGQAEGVYAWGVLLFGA